MAGAVCGGAGAVCGGRPSAKREKGDACVSPNLTLGVPPNKKQVGPGVYPDPGPVFAVVCALVRDFWRARLSLNSRVIPLDHPPVKRTGQDSNPQPRDAGASPSTTR